MKYGDDWALLHFHMRPNGTNLDIIKLVVIDATYIYLAMRLLNDSDVLAGDASIAALVDR